MLILRIESLLDIRRKGNQIQGLKKIGGRINRSCRMLIDFLTCSLVNSGFLEISY